MGNKIVNVFISHIHEDVSNLDPLKKLLKKNGIDAKDYSINSDKPNKAKDENYIKNQILAPRIVKCSVLVVYVSPDTKNSAYVNWEINYAQKLGKRIVGVWENGENGCELPEALEEYRDAMAGWHGNSIVDAILGDDTIQQNSDGTPCGQRNIIRHPCG